MLKIQTIKSTMVKTNKKKKKQKKRQTTELQVGDPRKMEKQPKQISLLSLENVCQHGT